MPTTRNALKAGAYTALWTFLALFGAAALGFLTQVGQWASAHGRDPFPDVSVLGYAFIAAVVAALAGILGTIIRLAQAHGLVPGQPPAYDASTVTVGYAPEEVQELMDEAHRAGRAKRAKPLLVDQVGQVTVGGLLIVLVLVILLLVVLGAI